MWEIVDDRARSREAAGGKGDHQPFIVMSMDHVIGMRAKEPGQSRDQLGVEPQKLAQGRARLRLGTPPLRSDAMKRVGKRDGRIAKRIGDDVDRVTAVDQGFGHAMNPDRRTPRPGQWAGGHHRDPQPSPPCPRRAVSSPAVHHPHATENVGTAAHGPLTHQVGQHASGHSVPWRRAGSAIQTRETPELFKPCEQ